MSRELKFQSSCLHRNGKDLHPEENENLEGCVQNGSNQNSCIINSLDIPQMLTGFASSEA